MSALRRIAIITLLFFVQQCLLVLPSNAMLLPPREASETAHMGVLQGLQVSPWSGALYFSEKDMPNNDLILPLEVTRAYSSDLAAAQGDFGPGWTWKFGARLLFDERQVIYQDEFGAPLLFREGASGVYRCPDMPGHTLVKRGSSYMLSSPSGQERFFDISGALLRISDSGKNTVTLEREDGRINRVLSSTGRWLKITWSDYRISEIEDSAGRKAYYKYDSHGRLAGAVRFDGTKVLYESDHNSRLVKITYPDGRSAGITFDDSSGRATRLTSGSLLVSYHTEGNRNIVRYGDDEQWIFEQDTTGSHRKITGPWGGVWEMRYENGRLAAKANPYGGVTKYTYDQNGLLSSVTDPLSHTRQYVYHQKLPLPSEIRYPGGGIERFVYNEKGLLTGFTDRAGRKSAVEYYPNGLIKHYRDVEGTYTSYQYDSFGLPTAITNSAGLSSRLQYDARGNLKRLTDPAGLVTEIEYTPADLPSRVVRGGIEQISAHYDGAGTVVGLHEAGSASYQMTYDRSGNISGARTAGDMTASYRRDSFGSIIEAEINGRAPVNFIYKNGSLIQATDSSGGRWHYTYDMAGRLSSQTDPSGRSIQFAYDAAGYLRQKRYSTGQVHTYTYDSAGRVTEASDGRDKTIIRYDAAGRPVFEQIGSMPAVRAAYEKSGRDFTLHIGDTMVKYSHNADGKLVRVAVTDGPEVAFSYNTAGNIKELRYSNGVTTEYTYDNSGRIASISNQRADKLLTARKYSWEASGQVGGIEYLPDGKRFALRYDSDKRLVLAEGPVSTSISYLPGGLRSSIQEGGAEIVRSRYDESRRLSEAGRVSYTYDASGNRAAKKDENGLMEYAYDDNNSLTSASLPGGGSIRWDYDAFGRRVSKDKNGSVERLIYFGSHIVATSDSGGKISRLFVPTSALDFPLFAMIDKAWYAYHHDINASIIAMTDMSGKIAAEAQYSAFGRPLSDTGIANPFGFAGMWYEKDAGLYYCRARDYDPAVGAFLQPDPFPGEVARADTQMLYAFAHNNPVTNRDPEGRAIPLIIGAALIGIAVTGIVVYPFVRTMGQNRNATDRVSGGDISDESLDRAQRLRQNINTTARAAEKGGDMPVDPEGAVITGVQKAREAYDNYKNAPPRSDKPPAEATGNRDEAQKARQRAEAAEQKRRMEAGQRRRADADRKRAEAERKAAQQRDAEEARQRAREDAQREAEDRQRRAEQAKMEAEQKAREDAERIEEARQRAESERREARERAARLKRDEERIKREMADLDKMKRDGYISSEIDRDLERKQRELDSNRRQQQKAGEQGRQTGGYNPLDDPNIKSRVPAKGDDPDIAQADRLGSDFQQSGKGDKRDGSARDQQPPQVIEQPGTYTSGQRSGDASGRDANQTSGDTYYPPYGPPSEGRQQKGTDWTKWTDDRKPPKDAPKTPPKSDGATTASAPAATKGIDVTVVGTAPPGKCIIVQGQLVPVQGYKENISGMTVTLTGPVNQSTTSSAGGGFSFKEIPAGDYVISVTQWDYGMTKQNFTAPSGKSIKIVLKGSCPYLYVWDGESYARENDIYSVARIAPSEIVRAETEGVGTADSDGIFLHQASLEGIPEQLKKERSYRDYYRIVRNAIPVDNNYRLKIVEQASEHSYTDFVELLALDHSKAAVAGMTRDGKPFLYTALNPVADMHDLSGNRFSGGGDRIDLYNDEGIEVLLPNEAFSSGIIAVDWQGFLDGIGEGHTASAGRPKLSLQRMDPQGGWQTVDWVYPRDEMQRVYFLLDDKGAEWDRGQKVRLVASSCIQEKFHRIVSVLWGNTITEKISLSSLELVSALKSDESVVLGKVQSPDGESMHLGPGQEVSLVFRSMPLEEGLKRTLIFVSEGFYVPVPMLRFAESDLPSNDK